MTELRILHVAEAFGGGLYEMVRAVANGSADAGHAVTIAFGRRPETPVHPAAGFRDSIRLEALDWGDRSPAEQLRAMRRLRALARAFAPDVVHVHSSFAGVFGGLALRGVAPIVYTPHSFASCLPGSGPLRRGAHRAGETVAGACAALVGAVSESEARCARVRAARRTEVIPNGIPELDPEALAAADGTAPADRAARVIAGGRIVAQRRPDACAAILGAVAQRAEVAWIGGGGEDTAWARDARALLRSAGAEPTGWVPRERWLAELREARVYLHWTAWDGLPLSVLEALAHDTIVVASDIPPNREVLGREQVCSTEHEAAALIGRILTDDDLARRLLAAQHARRVRFSAEAMVGRWLATYEALCGARTRQPA